MRIQIYKKRDTNNKIPMQEMFKKDMNKMCTG